MGLYVLVRGNVVLQSINTSIKQKSKKYIVCLTITQLLKSTLERPIYSLKAQNRYSNLGAPISLVKTRTIFKPILAVTKVYFQTK